MGYKKVTNLLGKLDKDEIPKLTTIMMPMLLLLVKLLQQILGMMIMSIIEKFL